MKQLRISQQVTNCSETSLDKYLSDISKIRLIAVEDEAVLAKRVKEGDKQALKEIVQANLRFVVSVSKQYQNRGLSLPDLINEGNMGLIKAASRFDETRGFRFISYAVWWIRQSILQALADQSRTIRLPAHQISVLNKLNKAATAFEQEYEREATIDELSSATEQNFDEIKSLMVAATQALSLDAPVGQEDNSCMSDLLSANNDSRPDNRLERESLCSEVNRALNSLPQREAMVIRLFFGLSGYSQHAVEDIADRLDISSALVRRLKDKALTRLRTAKRVKMLQGLLD
ncbi:MAG: RNA polymerase sigma factor RpoD/SigA [Bacteroidales bacterium]|jgi:RNA polymerase primary sigma factor|nr:RNA polymerase sigma factor RpoD/SigA [Bacteroidales bacterium]